MKSIYLRWISEETGFIDSKGVSEKVEFFVPLRIISKKVIVFLQSIQIAVLKHWSKLIFQGIAFLAAKINTTLILNQITKLSQSRSVHQYYLPGLFFLQLLQRNLCCLSHIGIFIVNKTDHSALYWGKYRTPKAAQANLKLAKSYRTSAGIPLFAKSIIMPLPGKQIGPGEWNLANATGKHTVIVAVFYNVPEADYVGRKRFAVQYCKQLRDKGLEAYYRHGPAKSFVTIGAFGASAVEKVTEGKKTRIIIHEQRIKEIMKRFPFLAVNGRKEYVVRLDPKTRRQKRVAAKSYPDLIHPKKGTNAEEAFNRTGDSESR